MKKLLGIILAASSIGAQADSLWTCQTVAKAKTIYPSRTTSTVKQSFEAQLFDDGSMLMDNHINSFLIPGTYYVNGRKAYIYPDRDAVTAGLYEAIPGINNVQILSNYMIAKFNRSVTQATISGHVDEQFVNSNGVFIRVIGNGRGKCTRLN